MSKRLLRWIAVGVLTVSLVASGWWAGRATLLSPTSGARPAASVVTVTVSRASIGRSLNLNVTVEQPYLLLAANALSGTVTSVGSVGRVSVGDVLYSVDTVPVRAVEGTLPFYRDLVTGTSGADVRQLQHALAALKLFAGTENGRYGTSTAAAVREWQRRSGVPVTGTVRHGELVSVRRLPASVRLAEEVVSGARLNGGEPAVFGSSGRIDFALVVSPNQAALIPSDAIVTVNHAGRSWLVSLGGSAVGDDGSVRFTLVGTGGAPVCGPDCATLPPDERLSLRATVAIVPELTGPAVPVAAIVTEPLGTSYVTLAGGGRREIRVLGSDAGVAIVDGLSNGDQVFLAAVGSRDAGN